MRLFRKTSSTLLKSSPRYRDLRDCFLGHGAKSMADRHDSAEGQEWFNEAVRWLGEQFGHKPQERSGAGRPGVGACGTGVQEGQANKRLRPGP